MHEIAVDLFADYPIGPQFRVNRPHDQDVTALKIRFG